MKKFSFIKFNWKYMSHDKKNCIVGILLFLTLGIIFVSVGLGVLFGYFRPFEKWVFHECFYINVDYFPIDRNHEKFIYYVDGNRYEKNLFMANRGEGVQFWYNAAKPNEIVFCRDVFIVLLPILTAIGIAFIIFGMILYFKGKKKYFISAH